MTSLQFLEQTRVDPAPPTHGLKPAAWTAVPGLQRAPDAVAVVLSFGALDARGLGALEGALGVVQAAASEIAVSCDVGVRTFARALTVRLHALPGWRTTVVVEQLAAAIARSHGVALVLSGGLARSAEFVDAALAASDHAERALAPSQLVAALDRARAVLGAASCCGACPGAASSGSVDRNPGRLSQRSDS